MHKGRVLHVHVKAARDVHRMRTYEIDVQRVETGSQQTIYIRKRSLTISSTNKAMHVISLQVDCKLNQRRVVE